MGATKTFGDVDLRSLEQLQRCMAAGDADFGVLCADHHPGYSQPIGGAIAYEGYVSPSGVGYDIGCIAAGSRVTTAAGYSLAIETVSRASPVACIDEGRFRQVDPHVGAIARGSKAVVQTPPHERSVCAAHARSLRDDAHGMEGGGVALRRGRRAVQSVPRFGVRAVRSFRGADSDRCVRLGRWPPAPLRKARVDLHDGRRGRPSARCGFCCDRARGTDLSAKPGGRSS